MSYSSLKRGTLVRGVIMGGKDEVGSQGLKRYLSPLSVWALSFGCAVGWGAFVMPGTTFLPKAGPLGTVIGIVIGAVVMFIIGMNYHYLINKYPDAGGTLTYSVRTFGYDHGFLSAWFLLLVYIAIIWANATALALLARKLLGDVFQFGFHYQVFGYDVYLGEILLTMVAITVAGLLCVFSKKVAIGMQTLLAVVLFVGIVVCFAFVIRNNSPHIHIMTPEFAPTNAKPLAQIFNIVALSPWAFVGFESVSNSAKGFSFSHKKVIWILIVSLICGTIAYTFLAVIAAAAVPTGYADWTVYIASIGDINGLQGLPTFYAAKRAMGDAGILILGLAAMAGVMTGLVGNYVAASRLIYAMAEEDMLPAWFRQLNKNGSPKNAFITLVLISLPIPFFGRTAIGWIIDVNTIGATIAYGYTSAAAFANAKKESDKKYMVSGIIGLIMSVIFFFYFMSWTNGAMANESYIILALWSILGFLYFRVVFAHDKKRRFGKTTVVWIGLLFLIFFTSLMWVADATDDMTKKVVANISSHYEEKTGLDDPEIIAETEAYLAEQMKEAERVQTRNSNVQMILILISLGIMFNIYTTMAKREKDMEVAKAKAEENDKAKSAFLSNMSHDIRTPMNAIIGYTDLAERDGDDIEKLRDYLSKIRSSSHHLLALINDVLEMSRIESGRMELELVPIDIKKTFSDVEDMFSVQMAEKDLGFTVDTSEVTNPIVLCDRNRINRVILNLVSNAWKYTPEGGMVSVKVRETAVDDDPFSAYEIRVRDNGIGMSEEFSQKIFEAFEREKNSSVSGIQGTGLGMAITKSIVEMMGGTISLKTEKGKGTEFIVELRLEKASEEETKEVVEDMVTAEHNITINFNDMRLLLVEDMEINREIANMQLTGMGFKVDMAVNGAEAVEKLKSSDAGYYDAVLTDIQMPVMDGYEEARAIRALEDEELSQIPIIAMTANAFTEDIKLAHDAGMNAHLAKPIDVEQLAEILGDILG